MSVAVATSQLEFDNVLGSRTCVFFWATWHEPSKPGGQMDQVGPPLSFGDLIVVSCVWQERDIGIQRPLCSYKA